MLGAELSHNALPYSMTNYQGCVKSSPYFYSKKYLKHFITKLLDVELQLKEKLKVAIMISPTLRPTAAWGSWGWTVLCCGLCCTHRDYWSPEGVWRDIFELPAKAWPGLPALASPTLGPHSPELPAEGLTALKAQYSPPPGAPGCCGPQSGWNHYGYFEFPLQLEFYLNKLHDEVLEIFFAGNTKENCKSLKPVSVHYRNEA